MNLQSKTDDLRREIDRLAAETDMRLPQRYALWQPPGSPRTPWRRIRRAMGALLRRLGLRPKFELEPWDPGLKHGGGNVCGQPLVIWAIDTGPEVLQEACIALARLIEQRPGLTPVLVTNHADFAFYSRLGWLVEYVPTFSGPADHYAERKCRYLAWCYRHAPALHVSAGLRMDLRPEDLPGA